jgi:hypothetical protein
MKAINIGREYSELSKIFNLARTEPVLLFANEEEFILSRADDFESEVEALRNSIEFQSFLNERTKCKERFSIDEIEKEIAKYDIAA